MMTAASKVSATSRGDRTCRRRRETAAGRAAARRTSPSARPCRARAAPAPAPCPTRWRRRRAARATTRRPGAPRGSRGRRSRPARQGDSGASGRRHRTGGERRASARRRVRAACRRRRRLGVSPRAASSCGSRCRISSTRCVRGQAFVELERHLRHAAQREPRGQHVPHERRRPLQRLGRLLALGGVAEDGPVDAGQRQVGRDLDAADRHQARRRDRRPRSPGSG